MIVDCAVYRHGKRLGEDGRRIDPEAARERACERGDFVWVGLHDPDDTELDRVARVFGLHPLAVEDAVKAHQRPKLERYADDLFMVVKTLWYVDKNDAVETGEINIFLGQDYVVTVRHGGGAELSGARRDLEEREKVLGHGPGSVLYQVCDRVVDAYADVADSLEIDVDEVEESVFSPERTYDARRIYTLKRELQEFRRAVLPLREPMNRLAQGAVSGVPEEAAPFFRDVADHVTRVSEQIEGLDALLSSAFDAYLARVSVQQNDDMRKISAWVAMAAVPTVLAGIYGMNFRHMPELHWRFGYPLVIAVMIASMAVLYRIFKRSGWL